jgi:hypothetical protein
MDAVENEQSFSVTRNEHGSGELIPPPRRRRFVPQREFAALSHSAPGMDTETFRADQEAALDHDATSPF